MPRSLIAIVILLLSGAVAGVLHAQPLSVSSATQEVKCLSCHTRQNPTPQDPCLRACSRRSSPGMIRGLAATDEPRGVILLDMLKGTKEGKDRFGPVPFDHSGHAAWAEIAGGCVVCHHYTPEGTAHPACRSCHSPDLKRTDIKKPSLKGAYHRQCMGCHREWSHNTKCDACHTKRVSEDSGVRDAKEALGHMTKPIPEPDTEIYQTRSKLAPGTQVIFRHKEHIHRFGLKCAECHRGDNCSHCHGEGKKHVQRKLTLEEHHQPCAECHAVDVMKGGACDRCHWKEGQPKPPPFDHARTGWPLSRYHAGNGCRLCHKTARFSKLDRNCNACHADWQPGRFDHTVTGQQLSEDHANQDCVECHIDRRFDRPPSCDACHEEDEGVSFPEKRPGPLKKKQGQGDLKNRDRP